MLRAGGNTLSDRGEFCRRLAQEAGRRAHTAFGVSPTSMKGRHDVVTEMDREVERYIRAAIEARYPGEAILGEEEGGNATGAAFAWIIDPIDGTANYARGIPRYCVSIACLEDGQPCVGALHDPSVERLYHAERGGGAWMNGERLAVSACAEIGAAAVECGWSTRRPMADYLALIGRVMNAGCAARRSGSGALGLADVAAGRIEAYVELHINSWDCAAGLLLVAEAGGRSNDFFTGDAVASGNPLVATNAALGEALADVFGVAPVH